MSNRLALPLFALALTQATIGCSRFVWNEEPFTPDPAPASEVIASGSDTTYVLRGASYYLLSPQRSTLWSREVVDDVAWRYRALFGEAPPPIAIRIDTGAAPASPDTTKMWRGMPFARVAATRRPQASGEKRDKARSEEEQAAEDSARMRLLAGPVLAATAAEAWIGARVVEVLRVTDSQPGGPVSTTVAAGALPAWIEAGALRILGATGAPDRAAMELRADEKAIVPLATLFAVRWQSRPNAMDIARVGRAGQLVVDDEDDDASFAGPGRPRGRRDTIGGVSPVFMAQSVSVLAFIHERDRAVVARLADRLTRGATVESVLATSTTLPHDVTSLDAEWRKWLKKSARRR